MFKKNKCCKFGRNRNQNIIIAGITSAIVALLVGGLIKNGVDEE
jgi:hypothetical protein